MNSSLSKSFKEKYFCQICLRQCHDKDGFNCHVKSKSHLKNMQRIANNPDVYIDNYSEIFTKGYLDILKRFYKDKYISANKVYDKYINENDSSISLNSTKWESLVKFIEHLKHSNKISIKPKDNDIMIKYIDNTLLIKDNHNKDKHNQQNIYEKILHQQPTVNNDNHLQSHANKQQLNPYTNVNKIEITLNTNKTSVNSFLGNKRSKSTTCDTNDDNDNNKHQQHEDIWIHPGLIVIIKDNDIQNGVLYNKKAKILTCDYPNYIAEVQTVNSQYKLKIDQYYLQPYHPSSIGTLSYIIKGKHKGENGYICEYISTDVSHCLFKLNNMNKTTITIPCNCLCKYKP